MKFVLFYHSLVSDWNHGNAHFLRGIVRELIARGHEVALYEPATAGVAAISWRITASEPSPSSRQRSRGSARPPTIWQLDLDGALERADVVIVHEWNAPELVARIGRHRARGGGYRLLFHDTHHRSVSAPHQLQAFELDAFDGILAFGEVVRELYLDAAGRAAPGPGMRPPMSTVPTDRRSAARRRPRLGRQLGRRRAHRRADDFVLEPVRRLRLCSPGSMASAIPSTPCAVARRRRLLRRLAAQPPGA